MSGFPASETQPGYKTGAIIPIESEAFGYCYYDPSKSGHGKLYNFDGELLGDPTESELKWLKSRSYHSALPRSK